MKNEFKFTWGQSVRIHRDAPIEMRVGAHGSVCGMRYHDDDRLYLVELADGMAWEVPESLLEALPDT